MMKMSLFTVKYFPFPHPMSRPIAPAGSWRKNSSTIGQGCHARQPPRHQRFQLLCQPYIVLRRSGLRCLHKRHARAFARTLPPRLRSLRPLCLPTAMLPASPTWCNGIGSGFVGQSPEVCEGSRIPMSEEVIRRGGHTRVVKAN